MSDFTTNSLGSWFGGNRKLAPTVGLQLADCSIVAVPFGGGMSELRYIKARTILVCDKHSAMINLAKVAADRVLGPQLYRRMRRKIFHPLDLEEAQKICREYESSFEGEASLFASNVKKPTMPDLRWAEAYFVCSWMARGAAAGTDGEFNAGLSLRYDDGGGDSNTRFRSATNSLIAWRREVLWRCNFTCDDAFEFLAQIKDADGLGLYLDPPWVDLGNGYKYKFTIQDQYRLAKTLHQFVKATVVIRHGIHPIMDELYPADRWRRIIQGSRSQSNSEVKEALFVRRAA